MKRSKVGFVWYCIWLGLLLIATFILGQIENLNAWPLLALLSIGHLLYFFESKNKIAHALSFIVQIAAFLLFLISIVLLSEDGTTWGNSLAFLGLFIVIPVINSFFGAARFRRDFRLKWYALSSGVFGVFYTCWRMYEASRLRALNMNEVKIYWGPESVLQYIGIVVSTLMVFAGMTALLAQSRLQRKLNE